VKVLLVDDDVDLLDVTAYALRREGFNVIVASDGQQALHRWKHDQPDVVVSDVLLPGPDGFEVCYQIRESSSTPVILLTGLNSEEQILRGFRAGADDYVTKPFSPQQLAMRIRAVWRRGTNTGEPEPLRELRLEEFTFDIESHEVTYQGEPIQFTPIEFKLLQILAVNCGRVVSLSRLVDYAWGIDGGDVFLLKTHISHIRKKLRLPRGGLEDIASVPRVGYRLVRSDHASPAS
jgi:DNA-binding response OmpR family regulator